VNKVLLVVVFALGLFCGFLISDKSITSASTLDTFPEVKSHPRPEGIAPAAASVLTGNTKVTMEELVEFLGAETPKTQFEGYLAFQKLSQFFPEDIEKILLSLDDSKLELKGQIAWFFAGKFPEQAFQLMETSMGDNNLGLARTLFINLSINQPEKVFDWLQNNENDFAFLFPVAEQQSERKMLVYQALSVFPDWKWAAYEKGMALVKESVKSQDKWTAMELAQTVARANPLDAITYALAQHSGSVDRNLLNGALMEYAKTNPIEAKRMLLENQAYLEAASVNSVSSHLLLHGHFDDAYKLVASLSNTEIVESVVNNIASNIHSYGSEKVVDFVASITDPALKVKAVSSATTSMSVAGYPVEKLLEILNAGLSDVPAAEKAFSYAWVLKTGYKDNPQSISAYLNQMKYNNEGLAIEVEKILEYIKDS
jgi:hypothetical protein